MNRRGMYLVRGTLEGDRIIQGPYSAALATEHGWAMKDAGYRDITVTHEETEDVMDFDEWERSFGD